MLRRVQHDGTGKAHGFPLEFTLYLGHGAVMTSSWMVLPCQLAGQNDGSVMTIHDGGLRWGPSGRL